VTDVMLGLDTDVHKTEDYFCSAIHLKLCSTIISMSHSEVNANNILLLVTKMSTYFVSEK